MTTATLDWTADQERALRDIRLWRGPAYSWLDKPYLTLGGYAGTGKTSVIAALADEWPQTAVCALAGKAAHVLRQKGLKDANTIHNLIYFTEIHKGRPRFYRKPYLPDVGQIIVDEASMVDEKLMTDLLAFEVPVLFVGDHGQLEPIGANPNLMAQPDVRLETIHRQERGNPIIRLATAFREGRKTPRWNDPECRLQMPSRRDFWDLIHWTKQIICGFNKTRHTVNARLRDLRGTGDRFVCEGDRLICLKNAPHWGLFNGQQVTVLELVAVTEHIAELAVLTDEGDTLCLQALKAQFGKDLLADDERPRNTKEQMRAALMDYGYAITAHKAQGSEWDDVIVLEEIARAWDPRRWRYTVATRARERLTYCS